GRPGKVVTPNGAVTTQQYDARGRLIEQTAYMSGAAQTTRYSYDNFGRLASVASPDGRVTVSEYDPAWRVVRESEQESGGTYAVTRYTYNNASLVTSVVTERTGEPAAPPQPPVPPAVINTPASGSGGSHTVSWGLASSAEYYVLEESLDGVDWIQVYSGSDVSWSTVGRAEGTYRYRIKACSASSGCSAYTNTITITVTNIVPILYQLLLN
ncbi:MAG: hypothetical protein ACREXR_04800, partial [Gammaproteobacteria bacterium]